MVLSGANVWSSDPVLEVWIEPETIVATNADQRPDIRNWIAGWLLSLTAHRLPQGQGLPLRPSTDQFSFESADLLKDLLLTLQQWAGEAVRHGWVRSGGSDSTARVAVEFLDEVIARKCLEIALYIANAAQRGETLSLDDRLAVLHDESGERRSGRITGSIVAAAQARGIPALRLDADSLVQLGYGARQQRIRTAVTDRTGFIAEAVSRDKQLTKSLLSRLGIPVPTGRVVSDEDDAWEAANQIGLPVVVKPQDADFGNGVSLRLFSREDVVAAYRRALPFSREVLVEKQLEGFPHRVLVVGEQIIAAVRREPARVVGDGQRTVTELVDELNRDPRRGPLEDKSKPWFHLPLDDSVTAALLQQGFDWDSVPASGQVVLLRWQSCEWQGGGMFDVTDQIHPDVAESIIDAVRMIGLDVAGVDLIAPDLLRPFDEQQGGILEINAEPAILVHMRPVCQPSRPVPEAIVSHLFPRPDEAHIPIVALLSDSKTDEVGRLLSDWLQQRWPRVGLAARDGVRIGSRRLRPAPGDNGTSVRALLLHPRVDAVVTQLSAESLRFEGLPFERCSAAVLLSTPQFADQSGDSCEDPQACAVARLLVTAGAARGFIVINVEDPRLATYCDELGCAAIPISQDAHHDCVCRARANGWRAAFVQDDSIVLAQGQSEIRLDVPRMDSLAVLAAFATAWGLGLSLEQFHVAASAQRQFIFCQERDHATEEIRTCLEQASSLEKATGHPEGADR